MTLPNAPKENPPTTTKPIRRANRRGAKGAEILPFAEWAIERPAGAGELARLVYQKRMAQRQGLIDLVRNLRRICEEEGFKWEELIAAL